MHSAVSFSCLISDGKSNSLLSDQPVFLGKQDRVDAAHGLLEVVLADVRVDKMCGIRN